MGDSKILVPESYSALKRGVREALALGKERAIRAVDREKVRTAWEVGKLIHEHVLLKADRADYGARVIARLSRDLGMSQSELGRMVEFARTYPISAPARKLSWSHYTALIAVNEAADRKRLSDKAEKNGWTRDQLRSEIKKLKSGGKKAQKKELLAPVKPGALNVFRLRVVNGKELVDLGFSTYVEKPRSKKLKIVRDGEFTYTAEVESVVDGDTLWCVVDLGLGVKTRQKLRFAGINAPELRSSAGVRAYNYLKRKLKPGTEFVLASAKSDKFDRYLAHVWVKGKYLNQMIVSAGHARVV